MQAKTKTVRLKRFFVLFGFIAFIGSYLLILAPKVFAADQYALSCVRAKGPFQCPQTSHTGVQCVEQGQKAINQCQGYYYTYNDDPTKITVIFYPPANTCWYITDNTGSSNRKDHPQNFQQINCSEIKNYQRQAANDNSSLGSFSTGDKDPTADGCGKHTEGGKSTVAVKLAIDIGCKGLDYSGPELNPILDALFAILRFLTVGVGLVLIASIVFAGIQFTASQGNPQATANALKRIANTGLALALYLLAYALLNWLVPGGLFGVF